MTPLRVSIAATIASLLLLLVVLELIRGAAPEGALRAALARYGRRAARALGVARRAEHDRGVARRQTYPPAVLFAVGPCSSCSCCCTTRRCSRSWPTTT